MAARTITEAFGRQVAAGGDRPAVRSEHGVLTYADLSAVADRCAAELRVAGVGPGHAVVLELPRSAEIVGYMIACLRLGAAYVPVDPMQPVARRAEMIAACRPAAVIDLAQGRLRVRPGDREPQQLPVAEDGSAVAYIIFTSGSTGAPKGVMVQHSAVLAFLAEERVRVCDTDVVAFSASPAFDISTWQIWGPLLAGAVMAVPATDMFASIPHLRDTLRGFGITAITLTTAHVNLIARHDPAAVGCLRLMAFGGEACDPDAVRTLVEHSGVQRIVHAYGPTETTVGATGYVVDAVPPGAATVPIGTAFGHVGCHVLHDDGTPVEEGGTGELLISGTGVAVGYVNEPALTAERFVHRVVALGDDRPTLRVYRTGDIVRVGAAGLLEFVGRVDRQVKVHGVRMQLEEIERALMSHPAVGTALVSLEQAVAGPELWAWVETGITVADGDDVRRHAATLLPAVMVPARVFMVDRLPLTPNGKLDRAVVAAITSAAESPARWTGTADVLGGPVAEEWCSVLGVSADRVDPDASFFDAGGNSLLAVELISRLQDATGVDLPPMVMLQARTLREMTALVEARRSLPSAAAGELLLRWREADDARGTVVFVHHGGDGVLYGYRPLLERLDLGCALWAIAPAGHDGRGRMDRTVEQMARRYADLLVAANVGSPLTLCGYSLGGQVAYEMVTRLRAAGVEVAGLVLLDPPHPGAQLVPTGGFGGSRSFSRRVRILGRRARSWSARRRSVATSVLLHAMGRPAPAGVALAALSARQSAASRRYAPGRLAHTVDALMLAIDEGRPADVAAEQEQQWRRLVGAGLEVHRVPGSHTGPASFMRPPHVDVTASVVQAWWAARR